jgi:hypothetical protein
MATFSQRFMESFALLAMTLSLHAQSLQPGATDWPSTSRLEAEDTVANKINAVRSSAKLPPLKRASPSLRETELVCTAAVTGRKVGDPFFSNLSTYVTADLSAENEAVKMVALGSEVCRGKPPSCYEGNPRRLVYSDRKWPRYSVIVERNKSSTPENPVYTVGVARRPSTLQEFFAPLEFDVPFKGMNEWKKEIAPECRNRKD